MRVNLASGRSDGWIMVQLGGLDMCLGGTPLGW